MTGPGGRRRALAGVVAVALVAGTAAACGVGTEDHPQPIDPALVAPAPTPTVTVVPDPPSTPPPAPVGAPAAPTRGGTRPATPGTR
jgi:hypothetical protein